MAKLQLAKGVRDISPEIKIIKNKLVSKLQSTFELYGFAPLETPIVERYETLSAKFAAGESSDALKEIFPVTDQAKRKLALRFDLTVPLARYVAMNPMMKLPFKRYEIGRVYRDGPIKLGRYREFWQCDIDVVGTSSMLAEAELLAIAESFFKSIDVKTVIKVNNRKVLSGVLKQAGIKSKPMIESAIISIDKLDKIKQSGVTSELKEKGFSIKQIRELFEIIKPGVTLKGLKQKLTNEEALEGISELTELFNNLKNMGIKSAKFDVSLARGLAYYTGTVFEAFAKSGPISSSLCGGGRYDNMIGGFMSKKKEGRIIPAVGISFGLEPIIDILKSKQKSISKSPSQLYFIPLGDAATKKALNIVSELRKNNINTSFAIGKKGITKNINYAKSMGIVYVAILGENEIKTNKITLKNMSLGTETKLSLKQLIKQIESQK